MPFEPGHPHFGGRPKGSLNKKTKLLKEIFDDLGVDVPTRLEETIREIDSLLEDPMLSSADRLNIYKTKAYIYMDIMQYLYPKRKAIDMNLSGGWTENMTFNLRWEDEEKSAPAALEAPDPASDQTP